MLAALTEAQVAPLVRALDGEFYIDEGLVRQAIASRSAFNVIHLGSYLKIDVFVAGEDALDTAQIEDAVVRPLSAESPRAYRVTQAEVLVVRELDWYRLGGESSERQWRDIAGILRLQGQRLDRSRLASLAQAKGLSAFLDRARADARTASEGR